MTPPEAAAAGAALIGFVPRPAFEVEWPGPRGRFLQGFAENPPMRSNRPSARREEAVRPVRRGRDPARLVLRSRPAHEQLVGPEAGLVAHRRAAEHAVAEIDVRDSA